jgi:hypothetical protein
MASGANHTLWLSGYNGEIYNIDSSGAILDNFNTPYTYTGIEVIGNFVYTDGGFTTHDIYKYDMSGQSDCHDYHASHWPAGRSCL